MPFQPINFANIEPIGNPGLKNLFSDFISGYKGAQVPAALERQRKQEELMNAFNSMKLQNEPQRLASEMEGRDLENALKKLTLQQQPQRFESQMQGQDILNQLNNSRLQYEPTKQDMMNQIHKAQLQKLMTSTSPLSKEERTVQGLRNIEEKYGKDSPEVEFARRLSLGKNYIIPDLNAPTTAFKTGTQKTVQSIDNALDQIKKLKAFNAPGQLVSKYLHPDEQAAYQSLTSSAIDTLIGAFKLPQSNESINLMSKVIVKQPYESDKAYKKRIDELQNDLISRRARTAESLGIRNQKKEGSITKELHFDPSTGGFR
jgi:hypothetical protein